MSEVLYNPIIICEIMVSKIDKKILEILQNDARTPITKIAKEVNMSENGVKYRLEKLEDKGIIRRFAVLIEPKKVGKNVMAIFNIEIEPKKFRTAISKLKKIENFIKVYNTTGEYSITTIGLFETNESLTDFVNNKFLIDLPIKDYTLNIVTKKYKDSVYIL
jgi:Lrp/AsnC family transcriptional regulator for asnA, asnC and gidA